jgi:hypothetical protein
MRKLLRNHPLPEQIVRDGLRSYGSALRVLRVGEASQGWRSHPEQPGREQPPANLTTREEDAAIQVRRLRSALPQ